MTPDEKLDLLVRALQYMPTQHKPTCPTQRPYSGVGNGHYTDASFPCTCGYLDLCKELLSIQP